MCCSCCLPDPFSEGFPTLWSLSGCHLLMRHSYTNHCKLANKFTSHIMPASHLIFSSRELFTNTPGLLSICLHY